MVCELCINKTIVNKQNNQSISPSHFYNHISSKGEACLERADYLEHRSKSHLVVDLVSLT